MRTQDGNSSLCINFRSKLNIFHHFMKLVIGVLESSSRNLPPVPWRVTCSHSWVFDLSVIVTDMVYRRAFRICLTVSSPTGTMRFQRRGRTPNRSCRRNRTTARSCARPLEETTGARASPRWGPRSRRPGKAQRAGFNDKNTLKNT